MRLVIRPALYSYSKEQILLEIENPENPGLDPTIEIDDPSLQELMDTYPHWFKLLCKRVRETRLSEARFDGMCLRKINFDLAYITDSSFHGVNIPYSTFNNAILHNSTFREANITNGIFYGADLKGVSFIDAKLANSNFSNAIIDRVSFRNADLTNTLIITNNMRLTIFERAIFNNTYIKLPVLYYLKHMEPDKYITLYKCVTDNYRGPYFPRRKYSIGSTIRVNKYDIDERLLCGRGLSVATLDWCLNELTSSTKILMCEVQVKDIIAIPYATDGKLRVRKLRVVRELTKDEIRAFSKLNRRTHINET